MTPGKVYLVGAGPGDPGLVTLKGIECLAKADLVLYDGLVNPLILLQTHAQVERTRAERTSRGDSPQGRVLSQQEINERLIAAAREGQTVVRLKGGDPFVFGRGGEEAAALAAAGIPFEVVPGVTAAVAASAYAGISLTHREHASAVAFITGHEDPGKSGSSLDYAALAAFPGTLVFYMGLKRLEAITQSLIAAGMPSQTPAAVISRGTMAAQQTVCGPLASLPGRVRDKALHAPSMIIIGDCVRQRETIGWFEKKRLFGKRVLIARPLSQAAGVVSKLIDLGAQPILAPTIEILPPADWQQVDDVLTRVHEFDWIVFTSVNGVRFFLERLWHNRRRCAAIDPSETGGDRRRHGRGPGGVSVAGRYRSRIVSRRSAGGSLATTRCRQTRVMGSRQPRARRAPRRIARGRSQPRRTGRLSQPRRRESRSASRRGDRGRRSRLDLPQQSVDSAESSQAAADGSP